MNDWVVHIYLDIFKVLLLTAYTFCSVIKYLNIYLFDGPAIQL